MSARDDETIAALSGGKIRGMPQAAQSDGRGEVDWHAVAASQVLSGSNTISRTRRSWEAQEPDEVVRKIAWDERSLHSQGIPTY